MLYHKNPLPGKSIIASLYIDILPGLKAGDSYGAQGRLNAAPESLRWVPAAGDPTASLTSQANRACPALSTLIAPTTSAFSSKPHSKIGRASCREKNYYKV